jgi:hypothetical protein
MKSTDIKIIRNTIQYPDGTILDSKHHWDYRSHFCNVTKDYYFVDGGREYIKRSINKVPALDLTVTTDALHEVQRCAFTWKSYGKNLEYLPHGIYISLADMTTDHILSILEAQVQIKGTYVEELMQNELQFRLKEITHETT